jgi:putative membrane protein
MGLANLVPGVSGGTMILAVGLYDDFIGALADLARLRPSRRGLTLLMFMGLGTAAALVSLAGPAVLLVTEARWVAYSLFIGMTLGGVPLIWRLCQPLGPRVFLAAAAMLAVMARLAFGSGTTQLPETTMVLVLVGALAASSMILPGVSGSYLLLILGLYDLVIGSLSSSALREDPAGSLAVIAPVVLGAALGVALLSNVLKAILARWSAVGHGALLGLLLGAVLGLYPFQEAVQPELARRGTRSALVMMAAGATPSEARERYPSVPADLDLLALRGKLAAAGVEPTRSALKRQASGLRSYKPGGLQLAASLTLLLAGFSTVWLSSARRTDS